ncbi:MAG: PleD family two-component system response regulator [Pseudomonadota bacterium]
MTARVLVVDDIAANLKLLEARLMSEYFEVLTASNGPDAIDICQRGLCDIVLLDVMMPGMDGFEVCRVLKSDVRTRYLPVIMVTALDQPSDRVTGLDAGADDFLTKPINDVALMTRVRSLVRLKNITDELRMRASTSKDLGVEEIVEPDLEDVDQKRGKILVVDDLAASYERMVRTLSPDHEVAVSIDPHSALLDATDDEYELLIISLALQGFDALRLCSQLRAVERTRSVPILLVTNPQDEATLTRAVDLGINDYIIRPIDPNELKARVKTQLRRKRYNDQLRDNVQQTMRMAVRDGLTGLNNRRYFESHMEANFSKAQINNQPLSLLMLDIDHFKSVNDVHGHAVGDDVLREFARRLSKNVRTHVDMACRIGGEEFVVIMPKTDVRLAQVVAERMRREMAAHPFIVEGGSKQIAVTVSAGIATMEGEDDTIDRMMKRADDALYEAKKTGRNKVVAKAA